MAQSEHTQWCALSRAAEETARTGNLMMGVTCNCSTVTAMDRLRTENAALREALERLVMYTMDDGNTEAATAAHLHAQAILAQYP